MSNPRCSLRAMLVMAVHWGHSSEQESNEIKHERAVIREFKQQQQEPAFTN